MSISEDEVDKIIAIVVEEAMQACRLQGRLVGEKFDDGERKTGYLFACDQLGVANVIRDHVAARRRRIFALASPPGDKCRATMKSTENIHETAMSASLKKILHRAGFERVRDLRSLSKHRFLTFKKAGEAKMAELETYLGRELSSAQFLNVEGESSNVRDQRYREWLLKN